MIVASDFLAVAERLSSSKEEPDWRTSVSRAYYALYNEAFGLVTSACALPASGKSHELVADYLKECKHSDLHLAGQDLDTLRAHRLRADYRLGMNVSRVDSEQMVTTAKKGFTRLARVDRALATAQLKAVRGL